MRQPPTPTRLPYTTLFRSAYDDVLGVRLPEVADDRPDVERVQRGVLIRLRGLGDVSVHLAVRVQHLVRSEEHTSELQSRLQLVCRLRLERERGDRRLASAG